MKTSFARFFFTLVFMLSTVSLVCAQANAQSSCFERWFHGGTYETEADREALYSSNAQGPLGGLFAPGFTRTLTLLGGVNFPSASISEGPFELGSPDVPFALGSFGLLDVDDSGYALSFAFGRRHSRTLRSEIEVAFRNNNINRISEIFATPDDPTLPGFSMLTEDRDGDVSVTSLLKNFIFDFNNESRFTPYAGFGLGISYVNVEAGESISPDGEPAFEEGDETFTYQAIGGIATRLNSAADFIVEYRFLGTSRVDLTGFDNSLVYNTSSLFFGLKYEY